MKGLFDNYLLSIHNINATRKLLFKFFHRDLCLYANTLNGIYIYQGICHNGVNCQWVITGNTTDTDIIRIGNFTCLLIDEQHHNLYTRWRN